MNRPSACTLLLALLVTCRAGASEPWPEIPSPPHASVAWVGDNMRVDGLPMRVMRFESQDGPGEVIEYYRACWTGGYPTQPVITQLGAAMIISQRHGPYFMTVKVEDAGGGASHGLIAVSRVGGSKADLTAGRLPLMPGARVISVVESDDPGKHSREVVVVSPQPVGSVLQFYQVFYRNSGWQQLQSNEAPRTAGSPGGSFFVFGREGTEMQMSLIPNGRGSHLVANEVTKGTVPMGY